MSKITAIIVIIGIGTISFIIYKNLKEKVDQDTKKEHCTFWYWFKNERQTYTWKEWKLKEGCNQ